MELNAVEEHNSWIKYTDKHMNAPEANCSSQSRQKVRENLFRDRTGSGHDRWSTTDSDGQSQYLFFFFFALQTHEDGLCMTLGTGSEIAVGSAR